TRISTVRYGSGKVDATSASPLAASPGTMTSASNRRRLMLPGNRPPVSRMGCTSERCRPGAGAADARSRAANVTAALEHGPSSAAANRRHQKVQRGAPMALHKTRHVVDNDDDHAGRVRQPFASAQLRIKRLDEVPRVVQTREVVAVADTFEIREPQRAIDQRQ